MKKILLSILASLILLFSLAPYFPARAADSSSTWYNQGPFDWYLKVYDQTASPPNEIFGERYTAAQVQWIFWAIPSFFINNMVFGHTEIIVCALSPDKSSCFSAVINTFRSLKELFNPVSYNSGVGSMANFIGKNHISGIAYAKNLLSKFNPVSKVSAQGFGYTTGASSIQKLWKISRDFSFALLIIAVIIIAFLIMFRAKINPQTVISIQSALPKIISAVILITFSYAIAGFIIDLMYVVIALLAALIKSGGLTSHTVPELFDSFTTGESAIGLLFEFWFAFIFTAFASIFSAWNFATFFGGIVVLILAILFVFMALWYTVKILILTFKTFVQIVLAIVTGPFEILLGTVAQNAGFGPWLKKLISLLAVYPVMALLFFLAFFFLAQAINNTPAAWIPKALGIEFIKMFPFNPKFDVISGNAWDPPLTTGLATGGALLWTIVGFVIITLVPKTVEIIQSFITQKPFDYGTAIGQEIKGAGYLTSEGLMYQGTKMLDSESRRTQRYGAAIKKLGEIINQFTRRH